MSQQNFAPIDETRRMPHPFHIVDVFAQEQYTGNQLAVVTDAGDLSRDEMQRIAAEIDYSETTFVTGEPTEDGWPVRIFTPTEEIPFAGHPTLGTAWVVREQLAEEPTDTIELDLEVGTVPVTVDRTNGEEFLWMSQPEPTVGEELAVGPVADVLGLPSAAIDTDWPVQVVSTGLPTILVPLVNGVALERIKLDRGAYDSFVAERDAKLVMPFCADPRSDENDLATRMFAPYFGVPEDPATGSATGCLAAYLAANEYFGESTVSARVEQGYEMGRPSLLLLSAADTNDELTVEVGGRVIPVATGTLH